MMKAGFQKLQRKILKYRNFKCFHGERFRYDLLNEILCLGYRNITCDQFEKLFLIILDYHAPLKTRLVRANNSPFMTKEIYGKIKVKE